MLLTAFKNRTDAGKSLAAHLDAYVGKKDIVVLGLPRGGVPVALEIAKSLHARLDVFVVGKLGFPGQPELAMGAITSDGIRVLNADLLEQSGMGMEVVEGIALRKRMELERKEARYRQGRAAVQMEGRTVILADDGAATGASMRAALQALRKRNPKNMVAAIPVASIEGLQAIQEEADETICLHTPEPFYSVGQWYEDFRQVTDEEVIRCLQSSKERQ